MSSPIIFFKNYELVIALNRKIVFVNPNDLQIFKEVEIEPDLVPLGLKLQTPKDDDEEVKAKKPKATNEEAKIQHVALSDDHNWLAVTTSGQKALLLYTCRPEHAKLVSVRSIPRASSAVIFSPSSSSLLVCDKTGDCYQFDVVEGTQSPGKLVLGHLSIVYDVIFPPGEKFIITSDRDEKIRVTNYPQCYDIANYCLGHKEYVSSIKLLPGEDSTKLVSLSGDETLKVWDYLTGDKLGNLDLPAPGIKLDIRRLSNSSFEIAVLVFHPTTQIIKYKMEQGFKFSETSKHNFPNSTPVDFCFVDDDRLYVSTLTKDGKLQVEIIGEQKSNSNQWTEMVQDYFKDDSSDYCQEEDVTGWFKKKYDNLTEYFDRKKKRMCV